MHDLLALLERYDATERHQQSRDKKQQTLRFRWQFMIGRTVRARTRAEGSVWRFPHNFRQGKGVYSVDETTLVDPMEAKTKKPIEKAIYAKATELLGAVDASYVQDGDFVLQVHAMDETSKAEKHTDDDDISFQYGIGLGTYSGGELITWTSDGTEQPPINLRNHVVKLDGRLPHMVTPVTSGIRYAVYFFKHYDRRITEPQPQYQPASVVQ